AEVTAAIRRLQPPARKRVPELFRANGATAKSLRAAATSGRSARHSPRRPAHPRSFCSQTFLVTPLYRCNRAHATTAAAKSMRAPRREAATTSGCLDTSTGSLLQPHGIGFAFGFNVFLGQDDQGNCVVTKGEIEVNGHALKLAWHVSIHNGVDAYDGRPVYANEFSDGHPGGVCLVVGVPDRPPPDGYMTAR